MAYRQPRIPEYNEAEGPGKALRALILFLKDFTMSAWTANNRRKREIEAIWAGMPEMPEVVYPVTSVNGKGGDVQLEAADVGALGKSEKAADSACLDGRTWAQAMLELHPVGSVYISLESTSPAQLFGGTWEQIKDQFLLASGELYDAGSTGGEAGHTLTRDELPSKRLRVSIRYAQSNLGTMTMPEDGFIISSGHSYRVKNATWVGYETWFGHTEALGSGKEHNNMPPYLAVNMWRRIADEEAA